MVKNFDFSTMAYFLEKRRKIAGLVSECSQAGPSQTLEPEFIGRCWDMFEERLAEARHRNSGTTTVWEFLGHIPLFSHEVAAEIGETIRNPESPSPIAGAIRTIQPERIFRDIERTVLDAPWGSPHREVLTRAFNHGMAVFLNLTGGPVRREETNPDSSTLWTTMGDGSLNAIYPSPTGDIHARIQLPPIGQTPLFDLVMTGQDSTNSPVRTFPSAELAMTAADAFAVRFGYSIGVGVRSMSAAITVPDILDPFELPPMEQAGAGNFARATRSAFVTVRTLPSEKILLRAAAKKAGYRDTSSWARGILLSATTGEDAPRLDNAAAAEIARLRRDLNSGIGANLNQALTHANTNAKMGMAIDEAGLAEAINSARHAVEMLRKDLQQALKPHGRP